MGKRHRFITESVMSMKLRVLAVIRDSTLSANDKERIIERIKDDCIRSYGSNGRQMRELQVFINTMLRDTQMDEQRKEETKTDTGGDTSGD